VKAGFVQSLARPGGNVTGITSFSTDLGGKRLELIKEAVPKVARIAVLYDPSAPGFAREVKEDLPVAARALKLTVQPWEVRAAADLDKVFAAKPADLPVEQPTKFEFVINLKTAKQIGLTIPPDLLARATKIIR